MKMRLFQIYSLAPLLFCIGCAEHQLRSEAVGLPLSIAKGQTISFKVRISNHSRKAKILPTRHEVLAMSSIDFISGAPAGQSFSKTTFSKDFGINRISIHTSPPQYDRLEAGDFRDYELRWSPKDEDHGTGALRIQLPYEFPELPLQAMTITTNKPNKRVQATEVPPVPDP